MAFVTRQVTRTSQPQELVGIDSSNPLSLGLRAYSNGTEFRTNNGSYTAVMSGGAAAFGGGFVIPDGGYVTVDSSVCLLDQVTSPAYTGEFSVTVIFRTGASLTNQTLLAAGDNVSGNRSIRLLILSATSFQFLLGSTAGFWVDDTKTIPALSTNTLYVLTARFKVIGYQLCQKNVSINSVTTVFSSTEYDAMLGVVGGLRFGREAATSGYDFSGEILGYINHDRYIDDAEIKSLSDNPWQIFEPIVEYVWIPDAVSGGTIYTLSPGGTVSFTGTSPELREKMLVPSGSFVLSGSSGFLREHTYLPSGTVSFSGTAPISQAATYVLSISGSVVFSGNTEYQRTKVQSASGTVSFTGTFPPLHEKTYTPSGTISFSGAAAENRIRVLSPTGEITFLGSAPIINPNAPAGQGTWRTLTGMGQ